MGNRSFTGVNMANDFDRFPTGDALVKQGTTYMSSTWNSFMESFYQNLVGYLTMNGVILPNLTTTQRDLILNIAANASVSQSPANGQLIYNTTVDAPQFYQVSSASWRTISFT